MTTITVPHTSRRLPLHRVLSQVLGEAGIGVALVALFFFFLAFAPHFDTAQNARDIMTQITLNTILAVGMTFVILVGGVDLSVGSVIAFCAVVAGKFLGTDLPVGLALLLAVLLSVGVGG